MKNAILAAIAGGLLISAQGAIANIKHTGFPPSADDIVSVGIERARDSQSVIAMAPLSAEDLVYLSAPDARPRNIVLSRYTASSGFPLSAGD